MSGNVDYVMSESSQNDHGLNVKGKGNKQVSKEHNQFGTK